MINYLTEQKTHTLSFERPFATYRWDQNKSRLINSNGEDDGEKYREYIFQWIINQCCLCSQEPNELESDIFGLLELKGISYGKKFRLNSCWRA